MKGKIQYGTRAVDLKVGSVIHQDAAGRERFSRVGGVRPDGSVWVHPYGKLSRKVDGKVWTTDGMSTLPTNLTAEELEFWGTVAPHIWEGIECGDIKV